MSEIRKKMLAVYPHLLLSVNMAKIEVHDGIVQLAIMGTRPDGSGQVICSFNCEEFIKDLGELIGWEEEIKKEVETPLTTKPLTGFQLIDQKEEPSE